MVNLLHIGKMHMNCYAKELSCFSRQICEEVYDGYKH